MNDRPDPRERSGGRLSWRLDIETAHSRPLLLMLAFIIAGAVLIALIVAAVIVTR